MRLLLASLMALAAAAPARAQETPSAPVVEDARIYLTWGAGYGLPGARSGFSLTGGDSSQVDTLYLSFDPGRECEHFVGMTGTLWIRSMGADTLGPLWDPAEGTKLPAGMSVEFSREPARGHAFPWQAFGVGHAAYGKSAGNAARIRLIWAVMPEHGPRVEAGTIYGLARLLIRRPPTGSAGHDQPVCVSWTEGTMAYRPGDEPPVSAGVRFVGINAEGGELGCQAAPERPTRDRGARPQGKAKKAASGR